MAKAKNQKPAESKAGELILNFIQNNRKKILIGFIAIVVVLLGALLTVSIRDNIMESRLLQLDEFERRFMDILSIDEFNFTEDLAVERMNEIFILLDDLENFQRRSFGFALARAHGLSADIFWFMSEWDLAERAWMDSARAARNTYLEPLSIFNAAVAAEQQGNITGAIAHYRRVLELRDNFPSPARAQFAIGRLEESRQNYDDAMFAYRTLTLTWPNDSQWASLAHSRIIALQNR